MDNHDEEYDGGIHGAFESNAFTGGSIYGSLNGIKSGINAGLEIAIWVVLVVVLIVMVSGSTLPTWAWVVVTVVVLGYIGNEAWQYKKDQMTVVSALPSTMAPQ